ncbi:MAG: hypothetical protein IIW86_02195, partial [Clostridia bacterium]|nr:hypothetical protein [Clostridia bacterium]
PMVPDSSFNDWYWEGMQGDDTDNIITEQVGNKFTTICVWQNTLIKWWLRASAVLKLRAEQNHTITLP